MYRIYLISCLSILAVLLGACSDQKDTDQPTPAKALTVTTPKSVEKAESPDLKLADPEMKEPASPPPTAPQASTQDEVLKLAKKIGCLSCHTLDKKRVGPAWMDVAEKYRNQPGARDALINTVKQGGSGVWGNAKMPAQSPRVSDEDIATLVGFILNLAKD